MRAAINLAMSMIAGLTFSAFALPAFPGAEGWAGSITGGRGGAVVHVTNLSAYGNGSFAAALATSGAKIIVFDVGGVINLQNTPLTLSSNTTIAGQTAPGGITLINGGLYTQYQGTCTNMIVRFIRVRRSADAPDGDCFRFGYCSGYILDHCSGRWNSDETLDLDPSNTGTIQYCLLAEPGSCENHYGVGDGYGNNMTLILAASTDGRITLYKNIFAHSAKRTPFLSNMGATAWQDKTYELINNVFYDDMQGSSETFDYGNNIPLNLIGNYYKGGLSASYPSTTLYAHSGTVPVKSMMVHAADNYHADYPTIKVRNAFFNNASVLTWVDTVIPPQMTQNISPVSSAYSEVMAVAGALPRTIREMQTMGGGWMTTCAALSDPMLPQKGTRPVDSDNDGMPDGWETAHGLDPNNAADHTTKMNGGYDALEVYLNELADSLAPYTAVETPPARNLTFDAAPSVRATPNPFHGAVRFTLRNMAGKPVNVAVFDISGRRVHSAVMTAGVSTVDWNSGNLPSGIYAARFAQGGKVLETRVSLIR